MKEKNSIMQMARGAFEERVDYEMGRVIDNILDVNTKATQKRKIQLTIELVPDEQREKINVIVSAKSTLAPTLPIGTSLFITSEDGQAVVAEMVPQIPGQMSFDGTEQEQPKILKLAK